MSSVNNVAPTWGMAALERVIKPPENSGQGTLDSPAQQPVSDTYTPGQAPASSPSSGPGGTSAAEEYQKLGRLGAAGRPAESAEQISATEQAGGANAPSAQNNAPSVQGETLQAAQKITSPYEVQQATNDLTARPDAALMSALSIYA